MLPDGFGTGWAGDFSLPDRGGCGGFHMPNSGFQHVDIIRSLSGLGVWTFAHHPDDFTAGFTARAGQGFGVAEGHALAFHQGQSGPKPGESQGGTASDPTGNIGAAQDLPGGGGDGPVDHKDAEGHCHEDGAHHR